MTPRSGMNCLFIYLSTRYYFVWNVCTAHQDILICPFLPDTFNFFHKVPPRSGTWIHRSFVKKHVVVDHFCLNALQLSQKRDRLEGQDSLPMKIKGWIPIKKVQLPPKPDSDFEWFHLIEDSDTFKSNRNLCCHYFMLDMTDKSQKSKFLFSCFSVPFFPML